MDKSPISIATTTLSSFRADITPWIITGIVLYFVLSSIYLFFRLRRLRVRLGDLSADPSPGRRQVKGL